MAMLGIRSLARAPLAAGGALPFLFPKTFLGTHPPTTGHIEGQTPAGVEQDAVNKKPHLLTPHSGCWTPTSTMRLVFCWLMLLPLATAAPIRARRENVVAFLNDALSKPTRKTIPAIDTVHRNPPSETEKEQDSEQDSADISEDQSFESANVDTIAGDGPAVSDSSLGGESEDLDSDETPRTKEEAQAPPGRQMGAMPMSRRRAQAQQSGEGADLNSEEEVTDRVNVQSMVSVQGSSFQTKESAEGAHLLDTSREPAERRSLEMRPAAVVREIDDDGSMMQEVGAPPS